MGYQREPSKTARAVSRVIPSRILLTSKVEVCVRLGRGGWGKRESDFSNKCWRQPRLILDAGNILICYSL